MSCQIRPAALPPRLALRRGPLEVETSTKSPLPRPGQDRHPDIIILAHPPPHIAQLGGCRGVNRVGHLWSIQRYRCNTIFHLIADELVFLVSARHMQPLLFLDSSPGALSLMRLRRRIDAHTRDTAVLGGKQGPQR